MILKTCFLFVLSVAWEVSGASVSNVFFHTRPEAAPVEHNIQYATPTYTYSGQQIPQYAAAPVEYEFSLPSGFGYGAPCTTSGCFYPGQAIAPVAQVAPSANIIAYNQQVPQYPAIYSIAPNEQPAFEYSYAIVNHGSRDYNVQSELSDGGAVRGEYTFLQPGGLVPGVHYLADDTQGFNAIVKNFLPVEEIKHTESTYHAPPCHESKSAALTVHETHLKAPEEHHVGHEHHDHHEHLQHHEHHEPHADHEARHGIHGDSETHGVQHETIKIIHQEVEANEKVDEHVPKEGELEDSEENSDEGEEEHPKEHTRDIITHHGHEVHEVVGEVINITHESPDNSPTHQDIIDVSIVGHKPHEHEGHEHHAESHPAASHEHGVVDSNVYLSYNDVMKCIQAAMTKANNHPSIPRPVSPLTYLVFNKPC